MDVRAVLLKFKNITVKTGMIFSFSLSLFPLFFSFDYIFIYISFEICNYWFRFGGKIVPDTVSRVAIPRCDFSFHISSRGLLYL